MRKFFLACMISAVLIVFGNGIAYSQIVDMTGGTAYFDGGGTGTTNNANLFYGVDYYIEDGFKIDIIGNSAGIVGDYYSIGAGGFVGNDVLHAHWSEGITSIVFSKVDGTAFDLNYLDLTSNTTVGGGQSSGTERSFITASSGSSMLLPSSDWGTAIDFYGAPGDGIARLLLDANFDGITSFMVTSENAYCFGLDNFYIDEPPPPGVPEPSTILLLGSGLLGLAGFAGRKVKR